MPGRIVAVGTQPEGIVADAQTRTVAVLTREPNELVLLDADTAQVTGRTALPGFGRHLQLARPGGPVLVPVESADALVRVTLPGGEARAQIVTGTFPHDASQAADGTVFVANELGGTVTVLRGDAIVKVFTDSVQPAGLAPVGNAMGLLDVRKNDLTVYDTERLSIVGATPAGEGPTHQVADRHGRLIVTDTRVTPCGCSPRCRNHARWGWRSSPEGPTASPTTRPATGCGWRPQARTRSSATTWPSRRRARWRGFPPCRTPTPWPSILTGRLFVAGLTGGVVQIIDA